jgi:cyclic peptide transporter
VEYEYRSESGESFVLGPINYEFRAGEIIFITGGNGSGKSTLAKIITGLYSPHKGVVSVNGLLVGSDSLGSLFSAIFADFYLFEKLYGIDQEHPPALIGQYLNQLRIQDKVKVSEGRFSTTKLSTGQRKRLALLLSYLEDKPICLFDEWAADQDPEFRRFFYEVLLPELRELGKCVIAITHDDQYFHLCDKLIEMKMGKIVAGSTQHYFSHVAAKAAGAGV